tara:strand:- start:104 stop:244 length:141 start_codon:yes stop_codon:yes gene_type:complete
MISFNGPLTADASDPVELTITVDVPLEHTSLASYCKKLGVKPSKLA